MLLVKWVLLTSAGSIGLAIYLKTDWTALFFGATIIGVLGALGTLAVLTVMLKRMIKGEN